MSAAPTERHIPVLLDEVVAAIGPRDGGAYADGTFGGGGYTRALLAAADCRVIAIDRDPDAIARGEGLGAECHGRLTLVEGCFGDLDRLIDGHVDGVMLDVGVSSPQIDDPERGFSFRHDGPLDMRMGRQGRTAADIVNTEDEAVLAHIIFSFGEDRFSRRIARAIVRERVNGSIDRTAHLADIVRSAVPRTRDGIDPATRTFQALRIVVNDELGELDRGLDASERVLKAGGRLAVVTFHSLEDRRVKIFMRDRSGQASSGSRHLPEPQTPPRRPTFTIVTRKPIEPTQEECSRNPRARSARLRVAERTDAPAWSQEAAA